MKHLTNAIQTFNGPNLSLWRWVLMVCALFFSSNSYAEASQQYKVKGVFLFKFYNYISWEHGNLHEICVFGNNPFGGTLEHIAQKKYSDKNINIRYLDKVQDLTSCGVVFIHKSARSSLGDILDTTNQQNSGILTVSDLRGFARQGGAIELADHPKKIAILLNPSTFDTVGVRANSKLLKVAKIVK